MGVFRTIFVPIHKAGVPFILIFATCTIGLFWFIGNWGFIGVVVTIWCAYFFRDPSRVTPVREGLIVSPADGVIQLIDNAPPPYELKIGDNPRPRICIFMNVFNVHINRVPIDGIVKAINYRPGKFLNASLDKASEENEHLSVHLKIEKDVDVVFVQIAGLIARRIICWINIGDNLKTGERFGMIRFGSRVDIYLPEHISPMVCEGQTVIAGESVLADLSSAEKISRAGKTH